ncbi:TolC family protein [Mucilaginibacter sp. FT3.2]|uniref:TolC family protein n=1 Tax=Mucilaginibacter sp. FT3.2 TaxID=2723090 RepID=UPI00160DADC2|nr:TolC family protein [Mucilaginibacter sp. FT3.2]MBB6234542.1 cobalt-zinc-cadmium efflux system outer membrane protein [Mucilaginibacter sp. FT3.2]
MFRKLYHLSSCYVLFFFVGFGASAQPAKDTLKLTINQAENIFLKNNLALVIQHYNIDNAQAQVITARLFQNPDFNFTNVLYNPETKNFFDVSKKGGEYSVGISQLFLTAGKRNKNIRLAQIGIQQSQYQFFDLLRTLRLSLRNDFLTIYFQQQSEQVYGDEINSLSKTLKIFKEEYQKHYIAEKEVLRIQSQLYSLQAELTGLQVGIDTVQSQLRVLLNVKANTYLLPQFNYELDGKEVLNKVPYQQLLDSAYLNRYDLKALTAGLAYNTLNLSLQRATAIPDITLGLSYDKQASYVKDFTGIGVSFPLPFFNRNQGAIKQARIAIDQSKAQVQMLQNQLESELMSSYDMALKYETVYNGFDLQFKPDFTHLIQEVFKNYEKRNISLLEFIDFYDAYKVNQVQLNTILLNRLTSLEQLNYVTGTRFFNK